MWTTKTENDSKDYCRHPLEGCGLPHGWVPLGRGGGMRTHKHSLFFLQYKTAMAPIRFNIPDGNPCKTLHSSLSIHEDLCRALQLPNRSIFYTMRRRKRYEWGRGREKRLIWRVQGKNEVSVFALLWFFVRPVRRPWFGARLLSWFLGRPGAWPPGAFRCARQWGGPVGGTNVSITNGVIQIIYWWL